MTTFASQTSNRIGPSRDPKAEGAAWPSKRIPLEAPAPGAALTEQPQRICRWKRAADLALVSSTVLIWLPLLVLAALAIRIDSSGPAIFRQQRYGKDGRVFEILKFRTMVENAREALDDHLLANQQHFWEWSESAKLKNDPRRTRIGRWLRRTSLDELPQLINILKGEMSLVGPRPIPIEERQRYGEAFSVFSRAVPGLTGLWQVSGRSDLPYETRVALDRQYVRTRSTLNDMSILLQTPRAVLRQRGAY